jgi:O-methyltransferase
MSLRTVINTCLRPLGYELARRRKDSPLGWDFEAEAMELIPVIRSCTMLPVPRLVSLYQQVRHCEEAGIAGAFVECGVWKGGSVGLMALANLKHGQQRRQLYLFDIFQEICEPDAAVDGARAIREVRAWAPGGGVQGKLVPLKGVYDSFGGPGTLEGNRDLLERTIGYDPAFIHYQVGWFQDTVEKAAPSIGPIAILRLDGDWYASTKICLEHLYDQVVSGGFVIVDDYGTYEGCKKAVDEFLATRNLHVYLSHVDPDCRYWIKP